MQKRITTNYLTDCSEALEEIMNCQIIGCTPDEEQNEVNLGYLDENLGEEVELLQGLIEQCEELNKGRKIEERELEDELWKYKKALHKACQHLYELDRIVTNTRYPNQGWMKAMKPDEWEKWSLNGREVY